MGYFNGMWNTKKNAQKGLLALMKITPSTYNGAPITGKVLYNHTGCGRAGSSCLEDIAEVFEQRAQELDATGTLGSRLEYFWESLGDAANFTNQIQNLFQQAKTIFADLQARVIAQIATSIASTVSNDPLTAADYAAQNAQLDALAAKGQVLLLVAHSQGNLFLNQAYDHILPSVGSNGVVAVQIAPASPTLRGSYVLANIDLVINALRIQGNTTVPVNNITLPVSATDLTGHSLTGTYLDPTRPARAQVITLLNSGLASLAQPIPSNAAQGAFMITLTWSGLGNEDLHVYEPDGTHVYYAAMQGSTGYLDTNNSYGYGPEHYFASCDPSVLQTGTYQISINNFNGANNETATVQVATPYAGEFFSWQINTGSTMGLAGNLNPIPVLTVGVVKNPVTGVYTFSVSSDAPLN
ncbi:MAG: hypothetical protein ACYCSS_08325 [Sulfuriferula sp.]